MRPGLYLATLSLLIAGCTLTPDYQRPPLDVPGKYEQSAPSGESVANLPWWDLFSDEQLQSLIRVALEGNRDLRTALARIAESRARVTVVRADQFPYLDATGTAGRVRDSKILIPGSSARDNYALGVDLRFELDLWGQLSRATEAAQADLLSTEAAYRNVTISLVASVASTYFRLRDLDARLAIAERTAAGRSDSLKIIQKRFEKGTVPELDMNQAQIELAVAEASIYTFERQIVQTENALRILLGRNPGPVQRGLALDQQIMPSLVPAGLPSELLQRRPDVISAEERLIAETARIGVAEALRYPSISLTGSYGAASDDLSDLTKSDARFWNLAGNVFAPLFNSGSLKARAEAQRARAEQALQNYAGTYQSALREVDDALAAVRTLRAEHATRTRQVVAARNASRLSWARYNGGVVDYLEVLDSERSLFEAELEVSASLRAYFDAMVELYKALGGGWNPPSSPEEPA